MKASESMPPRLFKSMLESREHLFVLLVFLLGYSKTSAYSIAVNPRIKRTSAQVLASHLIREPRIQAAARKLASQYPHGCQYFNEDALMIFEN